jgi:hypothetical protein
MTPAPFLREEGFADRAKGFDTSLLAEEEQGEQVRLRSPVRPILVQQRTPA